MEMVFKDMYLDRADMWRLARSLRDQTIYAGKRVAHGAVRNAVRNIYVKSPVGPSRNASSAVVTSRTRPIFRSESSRFLLLVQMAAELWEFEEDGELMYHKCVDGYLPQLFEKWRLTGARHLVTIVLFARVYKDKEDVMFDENAKPYDDYFKTVVDNTASSEWAETLLQLKKEFLKIQKEILVQSRPASPGIESPTMQPASKDVICGTLSNASQGNILEAIVLASQQFANSYLDPDILRTGLSVIVVTPGTGVFQVDKSMLERTTEDLMRLGVGIDLVCLGRMPLHSVPLFRYREPVKDEDSTSQQATWVRDRESRGSRSTSFSNDSNSLFSDWTYALPHWLDVSYWEQSLDSRRGVRRQWRPRCRMHELQMMGIMEQEMSSFSIPQLTSKEESPHGWDEYDRRVFEKPLKDEAAEMLFTGRRESRLSPPKRAELRALAAAESAREARELAKAPGRLEGIFVGRPRNSEALKSRSEATTSTTDITTDTNPPASITTTSTRPDGTTHTITRGFEVKSPPTTYRSPTQNTARAQPASPKLNPHHVLSPKIMTSAPPIITTRMRRKSMITKEEAHPVAITPPTSPPPWQVISNPSNPKTTITQDSSQYRRWQHVTPRPTSVSHMKWKSMRTPAALPLQSAFFPKEEELRDEYERFTYTVSVNTEEIGLSQRSLLEEMIAQRLAQGYQIVVRQGQGEGNAPIPSASAAFRMDFVAPQMTKGVLDGPLAEIPDMVYLTLGGKQIHRLGYSDESISVTRFVRRTANSNDTLSAYPYECQMWGNFQYGYRKVTLSLQQAFITDNINWNYMDALLSGWETQFKDSIRYKRGRWLLIPTDLKQSPEPGLDKEETHVQGIQKLNEMFQRGKWKAPDDESPGRRRKDMTIPDIVFCTESVANFICKEVESLVEEKNHTESRILQIGRERFNKSIKLSQLAEEMQAQPPSGVVRSSRRWHLKYYEDVFIGDQFVTWLVTNFEDIRTRGEGESYGKELMGKGLFEHCKGAHEFLDGHFFYRVSPQYSQPNPQPKETKKWWLGSIINRSPTEAPVLPPIPDMPIRSRGDSSASQHLPPPVVAPRQRIVLSSCLKLDVDTRHESHRTEVVYLHYDRVHNPAASYHIRIEWLTATTRLVHHLLRSISNMGWRYGLRLVEAPIDEISHITNMNPFREPLEIALAATPPASTHQFYYHQELLTKRFDFVVDTEAADLFPPSVDVLQSWGAKPNYTYTQYVHRTGLAFVQITAKGSFLWLTNRMYVSRQDTAVVPPPMGIDADGLREEFKRFCADERRLSDWFLEDVEFLPNRRSSVVGIRS